MPAKFLRGEESSVPAGWRDACELAIMADVASFESVADEYDTARPSYPDEVFDALGPLKGRRVLDVGAGTGIATRALIARQANVVAVDAGREVLRRAAARTPAHAAAVADGAALPVRSGALDLVCFAQAWHWLDESSARPGDASCASLGWSLGRVVVTCAGRR